ncbi:hypothetical protein V1477_015027 [Vespula maculifrons]|uniref:Uncharacterized protein n=2 Tax=Vespula TaxID=7451 RepID=A0A834JHS9_VESVU|nr:hypothetical protein HZH66_010100 [Vespula vulgaris]
MGKGVDGKTKGKTKTVTKDDAARPPATIFQARPYMEESQKIGDPGLWVYTCRGSKGKAWKDRRIDEFVKTESSEIPWCIQWLDKTFGSIISLVLWGSIPIRT